MSAVEDFIYQFEDDQRELMIYLHQLLAHERQLTHKISYKIPFYYGKSWICYLNPTKSGGIELGFTRGNELSNRQGLLDLRGRKQVAGIVLNPGMDIPYEAIQQIVEEAILLDKRRPYGSKRKL